MWIVFEIIWFIIFDLLLGGDKSGQRSGLANLVAFGILAALCIGLVAFVLWMKTELANV
jgi:hypothetical protein